MAPDALGDLDVHEVGEVHGWAEPLGENFGITAVIRNFATAYAQVRALCPLNARSSPHKRPHMRSTTHENQAGSTASSCS